MKTSIREEIRLDDEADAVALLDVQENGAARARAELDRIEETFGRPLPRLPKWDGKRNSELTAVGRQFFAVGFKEER